MDDVTDVVFRQLVAEIAPSEVFFTEFVSVDGLLSPGRERTMERLRIAPAQNQPLVAQIWGNDPVKYEQVARDLRDMGFAGIDINFGCPERGIVARGCCGGLIGNYQRAGEIIAATKRGAGDLPVSVKTRIGLAHIQTEEWAGWLLQQDIAALTIHARTVREMSKVPAHWEELSKAVALRDKFGVSTVIIGNGDITDRAHGIQIAAQTGVDGIMIGRGIFRSIDAFAPASTERTPEERLAILARHLEIYEQWGSSKPFHVLKKFFKIYVSDWPGAGELRAELMEATTAEDVRAILERTRVTTH